MCISFAVDTCSVRFTSLSCKALTDYLIFYMVSWFERARMFVILIDPTENSFLMVLLEDFFDSALVCACTKGNRRAVFIVQDRHHSRTVFYQVQMLLLGWFWLFVPVLFETNDLLIKTDLLFSYYLQYS